MSEEINRPPPTLVDPEKGTLETIPPTPLDDKDEKITLTDADQANLPVLHKTITKPVVVPAQPPSKPKPKPKKKVSRWIRFTLWFNTYRCAALHGHSLTI